MGSSFPGGEMCMEGGRPAGRRGAKKQAAAEHKANRQPQRGLGVARLEKIRLHNQMMAAYRSAGGGLHPAATAAQQAPFAAPVPAAGASSFQPYLTVRTLAPHDTDRQRPARISTLLLAGRLPGRV